MKEVILLKQGEIVLKGLNRGRFEDALMSDVKRKLAPIGPCAVSSRQSTITVEPEDGTDIDRVFDAMQHVFGINAVMRAAVCEKDMDAILALAPEYLKDHLHPGTFKVVARRSDKRFPYSSPEICAMTGEALLCAVPGLTAKMEGQEQTVRVEIRDKYAFIGCLTVKGAGGLPLGTSGRAALLLSGGIDSPVAGHMMAKRGISPIFIHFHSYPYTSEEAKQKVISLGRRLCRYVGRTALFCVSFTDIQQKMLSVVDEDYYTIILRRFMMRAASKIAAAQNCGAVITGESLAQVASQTMEAMAVTEKCSCLPVFKPLIGMDKEEIITVARSIDTFDISSLPYEDCCTVFTPRHPQTRPREDKVLEQESRLDVDALIEDAINGCERIILDAEA